MLNLCVTLSLIQSPVNAVYIGHSLISDVPDMVMSLAGSSFRFKEQFIPGAPLGWQWDEPSRKGDHEPEFRGVYTKLITSRTDVLVMVDSVPRGEPASMEESTKFAGKFLDFARKQNPKVRAFYYEPWHHITSGTPQRSEYDKQSPTRNLLWRERLTADAKAWKQVVQKVNASHPGEIPMRMIPVGSALGVLDDQIRAKQVPGITSMRQLFDDDIHLNPLGKYFVACLHYRAIFGKPVSGKSFDVKGRWGTPYWDTKDWAGKLWKRPDAKSVVAIQKIADSIQM